MSCDWVWRSNQDPKDTHASMNLICDSNMAGTRIVEVEYELWCDRNDNALT